MKIDPTKLTFGDLEEFERITGSSLMAAFDGSGSFMSKMSATELVSLVWLCGRGENPDWTIEDARKVKFSEIEIEDEPDPTDGSGTGS